MSFEGSDGDGMDWFECRSCGLFEDITGALCQQSLAGRARYNVSWRFAYDKDFMASLQKFRCEVCGTVTSNPIHWFVIQCGDSAEVRIPRKQLVSLKPSNISLMPEGLDESLSRSEFIDLLTFLQSQKSREMAQLRNP